MDDGQIFFDGNPVTIHSPKEAGKLGIEVVYQDLALCDNLDVVANMYLGREARSRLMVLREPPMEARTRETLAGEVSVRQLPRLAQSVLDPDATLHYAVTGRVDDNGHPGAVMRLSGRLALRCERCNEPMTLELDRTVPFRFVRDESELEALPIEDVEEEAVVGSPAMALLPWIEDEAILSLPLVPRHDDCALPLPAQEPAAEEARPNPFAALAGLRGDGGGGSGAG
jgi:uncharacterized metal-binding protein YceD (DUF177 family)